MRGYDFVNERSHHGSIIPSLINTSTNGTAMACSAHGGEVAAILNVGAAGGANTTCDVRLEESADNSSFTNIEGATFTQLDNTSSNTLQVIKTTRRSKRYVRAVATIAGGGTPAYCIGVSLHAPKSYY